jgi:uncharacterized membrane protein required for colicin V production
MRVNFADMLVVAYLIYGTIRGRMRGFSRELPKVVSVTLAFTTGFGLFRSSERLISGLAHAAGQTSGGVGFVTVVVGAFFLMRQFGGRIRDWAAKRYPDENFQRRAGTVAGFIRTMTISAFVFVFISFLPIDLVRQPFTEGSLFGRVVVKLVRPVYDLSHGRHTTTPK